MQGFPVALAMLDVYWAAFFMIQVKARNPRESGLYISVVRRTVQLSRIINSLTRRAGLNSTRNTCVFDPVWPVRPSPAPNRDQGLADHRPIAWLARLCCYRLNTSDPIERAQREIYRKEATMTALKKTPSVFGWYRILRAHYAFTFFQAVRHALWLAR